ncbi:PIG-L family deacetylase [Tsukamurella tyrosinosolvens]|uniref:GlcNAc-PI de-N-acetylase n=1 Tax=Tsukamurella tyrosinosolvens TaxID=57704 RepID=A0A1H4KYE7_TSUTY|nr:PIG-L family deacetylase [Tsukamurella tyrosinosolvens]AUN38710.1 PIG-L family deacetylase [Tsukamurella tyrosinosolvens]KXO96428.1 GlcNAc-PI de-N-acetylase [Tsukamurella tyrosinosolvens]KXP01211.1 GlcNAc-PI de-N-acetylase [Tsukamurella tyrosinosolvens]KZL94566.1 GlcNAc-PI de-N-acetylase [Tsukamurella tyrosinosolvens]MCA4997391.1 PIG-L family deacetylase [Tsukamurella tyrosinosolvens]
MIGLSAGRISEIAVLGAHCDDIAIGMGGTLLQLAEANPGLRVRAFVASGAGTPREAEERAALAAFAPEAELHITVLDLPDGRAPAHWQREKSLLAQFKRSSTPDIVFAPHRGDAHQDHRQLAELVPQEFRDHLILGYEILKWETDTPRPTVFNPLSAYAAMAKTRLLTEHYPSQVDHDWFDDESFLGLARLRGIQCRSTYAEGFMLEKAIVDLGGNR